MGRLESEEIGFGEVGSYLLGRDVGRIFAPRERKAMHDLLMEAEADRPRILSDAVRVENYGADIEAVKARLGAFRWGLSDR